MLLGSRMQYFLQVSLSIITKVKIIIQMDMNREYFRPIILIKSDGDKNKEIYKIKKVLGIENYLYYEAD